MMKFLFFITIIIKIKLSTSSFIFPTGCPLNGVSNARIELKNKNFDCNCGDLNNMSNEECLDTLDELHEKIRLQDLEVLNEMLPNICVTILNAISPFSGETALLISSKQNGYISYVISMRLIEYGADVNNVGVNGISPLINAIQSSNLPLVALLLINGANIGFSDNNDLSPLFHSVITRNLKITHFLLKCGANPNVTDRKGITPLYYLLKDPMTSSTEEFLELLLDYGSSITDLTLDGKDAISFLINSGNQKLLNKLIDHSSFARYINGNDIEDDYLSYISESSHNSTMSEVNRRLANAQDKILRIITAIKIGFDRKIIFSLLLPELKTRNKDICVVKDSEGRTLLWWIVHFGDDELIKLLVNFYNIQSKTGILEFELCDLHEPDIYGHFPIGHLIYNFNANNSTTNINNNYYYYDSQLSRIDRYQLLQEMLMFQNPKTNTTLWYELIMGSNADLFGEQRIIEYLSSPTIDFNVLSFVVRCFCKPINKNSIPAPRSIPSIGTYEYDHVISILSLLLLLNKNFTSKVVLQSILRESMLQSFWCIQALQHALITATILGKDDIIRNILMGRVQTLSEVLSKLDYSSELSIKVASRLLGSIPPEFPNLEDLMLLPITLLVRYIILSNGKNGIKHDFKKIKESENDENNSNHVIENYDIENNKILNSLNNNHFKNATNKNTCKTFNETNKDDNYIENSHIINQDLLLQYQFEPIEKFEPNDLEKEIQDIEFDEQMEIIKRGIRRGYLEDCETSSQAEISSDLDSIFSSFDNFPVFKKGLLSNYSNIENDLTRTNQEKEDHVRGESINGALNLLKQLLSPELTKFIRSNSFEHIIILLQNSTCNYSKNAEFELLIENDNEHMKNNLNFYYNNNKNINRKGYYNKIDDKVQGFIQKIDYYDRESTEITNEENSIDSFYRNFDRNLNKNLHFGNCLIELPDICDLMMNENILWVPMMLKNDVEKEISPTGTLILNSQQLNEKLYIPTLTYEYQKIHLGYLPRIPNDANITSLGPIISRIQLFNLMKKNGNCDRSSSYTTFDELLAKKAIIITLLNSSPHYHIIPSTKKIASIIILTIIMYLIFWIIISYLKVLYIKNMINEWSKNRIKKRMKALKNHSKSKNDYLNLTSNDKTLVKSKNYKVLNMVENKSNKNSSTNPSNSFLQWLTVKIWKFVRKIFLKTLPQSIFKLRDYAEIFPAPGSKKIVDSILLSLSLIFTSPWYIYKNVNKQDLGNKEKFNNLDRITKNALINAPMNYFTQTDISVSKSNIQVMLKYVFFFIQIISLIYLFIVLLLISEYEYIWFLVGVITTTCFSATIRTYYTCDFVSNYCSKYFCGFSKDYYLYNYYYYKKNIKRRRNIRNIYSKLVDYAYNDIPPNRKKVGFGTEIFKEEFENKSRIIEDEYDYYQPIKRISNKVEKPINNYDLNLSNTIRDYISEYKTLENNKMPVDMFISNNISLNTQITPMDSKRYSLSNASSNSKMNYPNGLSSSNITSFDSITSSPLFISPSYSFLTDENDQLIKSDSSLILPSNDSLSKNNNNLLTNNNKLSADNDKTSSKMSSLSSSSFREESFSSSSTSKNSNIEPYNKYMSNNYIINRNNTISNSSSGIGISNSSCNDLVEGIVIEKKNSRTVKIKSTSNIINKKNYLKNHKYSRFRTNNSILFNRANLTINYKRFKKNKKHQNSFNQISNFVSDYLKKVDIDKFRRIISSVDEKLSCDNIRTNIGNVATDNKIHKPLYKLVDEVSYNSPQEYFYIATTCKIISILIAMSSNISIALFKSNSYLFRDSTLYFLYNKSPLTVYLIECIFIFWLSNFIFEIMKGLIILLFFVKQRKRLCLILVQHIPTQFKYSNVQEFIQIVSYWRSAIQHILYKNTKLWTTFLNVSVSVNTIVFFCIGKIMLFMIYQKKRKIFNSQFFNFSLRSNMLDGFNIHNINNFDNEINNNKVNRLSRSSNYSYKKKLFSNHQIVESTSNVDNLLELDYINDINKNIDLISLISPQNYQSLSSKYKSYNLSEELNSLDYMHIVQYPFSQLSINGMNSLLSPIYSIETISDLLPNYRSSILTMFSNNANITANTSNTNFPNIYSNCEIIFLTLSVFMFIFFSYVIRLLYQINRSSVRTHSWLQNILHRTPPGAGIYIVIEKVLLVINSTPPILKICGFDVTERFSGFTLYIFTPIFILIFVKFIIS